MLIILTLTFIILAYAYRKSMESIVIIVAVYLAFIVPNTFSYFLGFVLVFILWGAYCISHYLIHRFYHLNGGKK